MKNRCLYCFKEMPSGSLYHPACSKKFFGSTTPPQLPYRYKDLNELAHQTINKRLAIPGVQPKLSLDFEQEQKNRLTIVGLWGRYVFKPPVPEYPGMVELEHLTMKMAERSGISTAECALIPLASGELCYLTKRFDRNANLKLRVEDMAQITEVLTENKYHSSLEKIGSAIFRLASYPLNDLYNFFKLVLYSFVTGNADMHLKNFSLLESENKIVSLSPAYDLVPTKLLLPEDSEESALPMLGKKSNFKREDFLLFGEKIKLSRKQSENAIQEILNCEKIWLEMIELSFVSKSLQVDYCKLLTSRLGRLREG